MGKASKKNPIRVLQIGMHDKIGGVETYLMNYYRNIDKSKVQFDFVSIYEKLCFEDEIKKMKGKIYHITSMKKNPIKYYYGLKKIIADNNYKIVHINMLSAANILPLLIAKNMKVKNIIAHSHNTNTPSGLPRKFLDKLNRKKITKANHYWACSKKAGIWLFGEKSVDKIEIINNAIDYDKFSFDLDQRNLVRQQLNIQNKFVIGNVARFSYQKNQSFLIDVFHKLQEKINNSILLLIGEGELEQELKNKVDKLGLNDKVIFFGTTNDVGKYLQAMDIFVLPSLFEGLPVTGIEAQASGTYCIFSSNITEETKISDNCKFVDLNVNDWVNAIEEIYINGYKKESSNMTEKYNIRIAAKKLEKKYIDMYNE